MRAGRRSRRAARRQPGRVGREPCARAAAPSGPARIASRPAKARGLLLALLLALPAAAITCAGGGAETPELRSVAVPPDTALLLRRRVEGFYLRLAGRRFNTLETYSDRIMREHFLSPNLFLDYYADLAQAFADAHLEKRRPLRVDVLELRFEDTRQARVEVRFVGDDDRPLRPFEVSLLRVDRWQWSDGTWWVQPGKI